MSASTNPPDLGSQTWERAAEAITVSELSEQARSWLRESQLPGTKAIKDGDWPLVNRVEFLKRLCGQEA